MYLVSEEDELAQNGEGFEILGEGPEIVAYEAAIEGGMEEDSEDSGGDDEIV